MTPEQLTAFMEEHRAERTGKIRDQDFANMLGISRRAFVDMKAKGARTFPFVFLLALSAIRHNLKPYGDE